MKQLNEILPKFTVLDLSLSDIEAGFNSLNKDTEDSVYYILSQKTKCDTILTNNTSDFDVFKDVRKVKPLKNYPYSSGFSDSPRV